MSEKRNDGGWAFPYPSLEAISITAQDGKITHQEGMAWRPGNCSMLDLFAAAALQGQLAGRRGDEEDTLNALVNSGKGTIPAILARGAYEYAEAMLAERERRLG